MGKNHYPINRISVPVQLMAIKNRFPEFSSDHLKCNRLRVSGRIQPTPNSTVYKVAIEYEQPKYIPYAYVVEPKLISPTGAPIPHTYPTPSLRPCLYYPNGNEWNSSTLIADTIIPWLSEWLYYYETWLITNKWCGGGINHSGTK